MWAIFKDTSALFPAWLQGFQVRNLATSCGLWWFGYGCYLVEEPSAATRQWDQGGLWRISDRAGSCRFLSFGVKMCYKRPLYIRKTWTDVTKQLPLPEGWRCRQLERLLDMFSPSAGLWAARPVFTNYLAVRFHCEPLCDVFHTLCLAAWHRSCAPNLFRTHCKC